MHQSVEFPNKGFSSELPAAAKKSSESCFRFTASLNRLAQPRPPLWIIDPVQRRTLAACKLQDGRNCYFLQSALVSSILWHAARVRSKCCTWGRWMCVNNVLLLNYKKKKKISVPVSITQEEAPKASKYCTKTLLQSKIPSKEKHPPPW